MCSICLSSTCFLFCAAVVVVAVEHGKKIFTEQKHIDKEWLDRLNPSCHPIFFSLLLSALAFIHGLQWIVRIKVVEDKCCSRKSFYRLNYGLKHSSPVEKALYLGRPLQIQRQRRRRKRNRRREKKWPRSRAKTIQQSSFENVHP